MTTGSPDPLPTVSWTIALSVSQVIAVLLVAEGVSSKIFVLKKGADVAANMRVDESVR
jgi:hypothetical protein